MSRFAPILLILIALVAACGGGKETETASQPTETDTERSDELSSGEDELRRTAQEALEAFARGDNAKFYSFFAADFRDQCPLEDFIGVLALAQAFLGDVSDAEVEIEEIRFEGERAFVDAHLELDGTEVDYGDDDDDQYPSYWILEEGEWKTTTDDPSPCGLGEDDVSAASETPEPQGPGTSRLDPLPRGQTVRTPEELEVTIIDVNLDAWLVVQAENQFNDPPAPGNRLVLVRVKVTNAGSGQDTVTVSQGDFSMTGSANVLYDTFSENSRCGVIPDELQGEMFSGGSTEGNVCFQIPQAESGLILVVDPLFSFESADRRYLSLE